MPTPPDTTNAPLLVFEADVLFEIFSIPAELIFPSIPIPPVTCRAPVAVLVDTVVSVILTTADAVILLVFNVPDTDALNAFNWPFNVVIPLIFTLPPTPRPPATCNAPVAVFVDAFVPYIFVNPFTCSDSPIPTPPATLRAPVTVLDAEDVEFILIAEGVKISPSTYSIFPTYIPPLVLIPPVSYGVTKFTLLSDVLIYGWLSVVPVKTPPVVWISPPTYTLPSIPAPPFTRRAPVKIPEDEAVLLITSAPSTSRVFRTQAPPSTRSAGIVLYSGLLLGSTNMSCVFDIRIFPLVPIYISPVSATPPLTCRAPEIVFVGFEVLYRIVVPDEPTVRLVGTESDVIFPVVIFIVLFIYTLPFTSGNVNCNLPRFMLVASVAISNVALDVDIFPPSITCRSPDI